MKIPKTKFFRNFQKRFFLRFHMSLILGATTATGLLSTKGLLSLGVDNVVIRYPLTVLIAYLAFFLFIKIWLWYVTTENAGSQTVNNLDAVDVIPDAGIPFGGGGGESVPYAGGGGHFGGGGASGGYEDSSLLNKPVAALKADSGGGSSSGSGIDLDIDGDGIMPLVILGVILAAVFGVGLYLVVQAPIILSDVAFEFMLAAGLVRPMKRLDDPDWMGTVLRTTWIPFALVFGVTTIAAWQLHKHYPDAVRLLDLIK